MGVCYFNQPAAGHLMCFVIYDYQAKEKQSAESHFWCSPVVCDFHNHRLDSLVFHNTFHRGYLRDLSSVFAHKNVKRYR